MLYIRSVVLSSNNGVLLNPNRNPDCHVVVPFRTDRSQLVV